MRARARHSTRHGASGEHLLAVPRLKLLGRGLFAFRLQMKLRQLIQQLRLNFLRNSDTLRHPAVIGSGKTSEKSGRALINTGKAHTNAQGEHTNAQGEHTNAHTASNGLSKAWLGKNLLEDRHCPLAFACRW